MSKFKRIDESVVIPVARIFVDAVNDQIFATNKNDIKKGGGWRVPAKTAGYQRDPYKRLPWLLKRGTTFSRPLCRPIEVGEARAVEGSTELFHPVFDGGGRWLMAQIAGQETLVCRVHYGLSRAEEAKLFDEFDSETLRLKGVDRFLARLAAGAEEENDITEAISPYTVGVGSHKKIDAVGVLRTIYRMDNGLAVMARTAKIVANTWGGFGSTGKSYNAPGNLFGAIAILVTSLPSYFDEGILREIMEKYPPATLEALVKAEWAKKPKAAVIKLTTDSIGIQASGKLATLYNTSVKRRQANPPVKGAKCRSGFFDIDKLDTSPLSKAIASRFSFKDSKKAA
jgi:hypothetical protein